MYEYLKNEFPNIIDAARTGPYKYEWRIVFGSMLGRNIKILLIEVSENRWTIDAFREIIHEGRIVDTTQLLHTCTMPNKFGQYLLDEIGSWLDDFSNYKKIDDEQHKDGDVSRLNYKIICGEGNDLEL
jgi:hypothetical protein